MSQVSTSAASEERARRNAAELIRWKAEAAKGAELPPQSLGVVGAGLMGSAIAAAGLRAGLSVRIADASEEARSAARARIAAELAEGLTAPAAENALRRLGVEGAVEGVAACELVVESIMEEAGAKQSLYARLEPRMATGAVLASNTSTIPIGRLAAALSEPARFCGLHFFHPVGRRPLVEIVCGAETSARTVAAAQGFVRAIGKLPIVAADGPGFLVNRLLVPYLGEALEMLLEGATIEEIEGAATGFGMAMGPLKLVDEIGVDTTFLAGRVLWEAFPERVAASPLLVTLVKRKRLGRKAGAGFFAYAGDGAAVADPAVEAILAQWRRGAGGIAGPVIRERLLLPMVLEATRIIEEGRVGDVREIELGVLLGLGFPAARGGLLWWADELGAAEIVRRLAGFAALGPRMQPTELLVRMAREGRRFYDGLDARG